ncbi:MAG: amino acid ABC transporter substrate-binding protein [Anaerolineae bacterium]|nr:amino acid ABC transporter substrate-binding protein [Anaerolineae bacterium]
MIGHIIHRFLLVILLCLFTVLVLGCAPQAETASAVATSALENPLESLSGLARIQADGVLLVGTAVTEPFEYYDPQTGEWVGLDVDIAQRIAQALGVELQWVEMPFASLIPALQEHKVDMTIAAMYITAEREELVDFADPYLDTGLVMAAKPGLAAEISSTNDLSGLRVGVKIGSTGARLAEELLENGTALNVVEYKDTLESLLDLEVGRVDVVFNDYLNTLVYIKDTGSSIVIVSDQNGDPVFLSRVGLGIAVPAGEAELLDFINQQLTAMAADETLVQLQTKWLEPEGE